MLKRWLKYYNQANSHRNDYSPFVAKWIKEVLEDDREYYAFSRIENIRLRMQASPKEIAVTDLGAGSRKMQGNTRKISDIAKISASTNKKGKILFKTLLAHPAEFKIELGTSLGIGSLYQYYPNTQHNLYTIEGCPNTYKIAADNFKRLKIKNIQQLQGNFDEMLPKLLKNIPRLDYAFIDGNHTGEATLRYFEECLQYCHSNTVLIFDDIHWSADMETAWRGIIKHPKVKLSLDIWDMGFVFFRKDEKQQHLTLIHSKYKPWKKNQ